MRPGCVRYPGGMPTGSRIDREDRSLIRQLDAALRDAARKSGPWLVCHPGCHECCIGPFGINQLDAYRLKAGLAELSERDPGRAARVGERARATLGRFAQRFPSDPVHGALTENPTAEGWHPDNEPCPALDPETRTCDLYQARPVICRSFGPPVPSESGSLGICEKCFQGATDAEIAACSVEVDPGDAEARLIQEVEEATGVRGTTIVAACLDGN